ncbi:MAG: MFS transporter [Candidatus Thorarchaeota archaeon]
MEALLSTFKKFVYGIGRFGSSLLLTVTDLTVFYIYGALFELSWLLSGIALSLSYVVIGLTHWLTGYISDQVDTGLGRRKPFVIFGAPGLAIATFMLFIPNWFMNTSDSTIELLVFGYYTLFICLTKFFYAFLLTAFQAWMPEITDENDRPIVSSLQNTSNWIGTGLGIAMGILAVYLFAVGPPAGLSELGTSLLLAFCIIEVLFFIPSIIWIREGPDIVIPTRSLVNETMVALRNRDYVGWMLSISFLSFAFTAITAQIIGFAQNVLLLDSIDKLLLPALALVISIMVFLYIWIIAINRLGKGRSLILSMVILAIMLIDLPFLAQLSHYVSPIAIGIVIFIPMAACMAVYYLLSYIVTADIAHVDELKTGQNRAGIYEGFKGVPFNFSQALSALLLGIIMDYSFHATGSNVFGLTWWAPIFAPFLLLGALLLNYIDIDPDFESLKTIAVLKKPVKKKKKATKKKKETATKTTKKKTSKKSEIEPEEKEIAVASSKKRTRKKKTT